MKMETVGLLAGGMALEVVNLLNGITGNVSRVLSEMKTDDAPAESLLEAKRDAVRATALLRQFLAFPLGRLVEDGTVDPNDRPA